MNTHPLFNLVIGLDRSDQKAGLQLIHTATGAVTKQIIDTSPKALHDWPAKQTQWGQTTYDK